jgi:hypothetical protein
MLMNMGFGALESVTYLRAADGDVNTAAAMLFEEKTLNG